MFLFRTFLYYVTTSKIFIAGSKQNKNEGWMLLRYRQSTCFTVVAYYRDRDHYGALLLRLKLQDAINILFCFMSSQDSHPCSFTSRCNVSEIHNACFDLDSLPVAAIA